MLCNLLRPNTITLIITAITITTKIKSNRNRNNNVIANAIARRWRFLHVLKFAKKNMDYFKVNNPAMLNYNLQINVLIQWIFAENASAFNRWTKMVIDANKTNIKQCQHHIEKLNKWHQRNMLGACYGNFVNIECFHSLYFWIVNRQTVSFRTIPWGQTKSFQFYFTKSNFTLLLLLLCAQSLDHCRNQNSIEKARTMTAFIGMQTLLFSNRLHLIH